MIAYLISFPAKAMNVPAEELAAVGEAAHAVIREAKAAGIHVFSGGIDAAFPPLLVAGDATVDRLNAPETRGLDGGFCVLRLPSYDLAVAWAAKLARACRCPQELRVFGADPEA